MRRYGVEFNLLGNCEDVSEIALSSTMEFRRNEHRAIDDASGRRNRSTAYLLFAAVVMEIAKRPLSFGLTTPETVHQKIESNRFLRSEAFFHTR